MKRFIMAAALSVVALSFAAAEETPGYDELMKTANAAFEAEDWRAVATTLDAAQALRPYSQFLARNRVLAYSMLGDFTRAEAIVKEYADHGLSLRLAGHEGFDALTARPEFEPIRARMNANLQPTGESAIVAEIANDGLLPETVALATDDFFVGSVRTGAIVRRDGALFAIAPGGVYDLEISGKTLWAAVNSASPYEKAPDAPAKSGLRGYRLIDGGETASVTIGDAETLIGDLEKAAAGIVASDSLNPRLFILRDGEDEPAILATDKRFVNLQGLAYDKRRKTVFVADYLAGIFAVDVKTGAVSLLHNPSGEHLGGIDGLYLYKGDLIGIQNGTSPQRIVRMTLDRRGEAIQGLAVLVQNHAQWAEPTNGKIVGPELHYVATSNWPAYGADGALDKGVARAPVRIMSVRLDR